MDVAWLILDSVSFSATPFAPDGPDTMPRIADLTERDATIFTRCYAPGQASPSSHGAFFTGRFPTETGMHEVSPDYAESYPTVADAADGHESLLVTKNPFLDRGLHRGFDETRDLRSGYQPPFEGATTPADGPFPDEYPFQKHLQFLFGDGKPVRSLANGVHWKLTSVDSEADTAQPSIDEINREIRQFRGQSSSDSLVVANYMAAHAPFDPPRDALERFVDDPDADDLPIGKSGRKTRQEYLSDPEYDAEDMYRLYLASIWDLDRKVAPLIEELLADGALVAVTADHGNWFRIDSSLEEDRIHVPLVVFEPESSGERVGHTVNLRHLAATTTGVLQREHPEVDRLPGENLLEVESDLASITEFIDHNQIGDLEGHPVAPEGLEEAGGEFYYYVSAIRGDAKLNYDAGEERYEEVRGDPEELSELREIVEEHTQRAVNTGSRDGIEYDEATKERLEQLGYLS